MSVNNLQQGSRAGGLQWRGLDAAERNELLLLAALALLLPFLALAPNWPGVALLRIPLGLAGALLAPGYALVLAAFPRRSDLDLPARAGLSFGLSVALLPLLALLLDGLPWGIRPLPMAFALSTQIGLCVAVSALRRAAAPPEPTAGPPQPTLRLLAGPLLLLLLLLALTGLGLGLARRDGPALTEFYALSASGLAESYPRLVAPGEPIQLRLGIINQEGRPMTYRVEAHAAGAVLAASEPISLAAGENWEQPVSYVLSTPGERQPVELLLFVEGRSEPYRRLQLWVDVTPAR